MSYVELFNDEILDTISIGKSTSNFDESSGDYIKVEVFDTNSNTMLGRLYSNRLLFKYPQSGKYYVGDYHFHPEEPSMGFCEGRIHTDESMQQLQPETVGSSVDEPVNAETIYKKQVDIFKDDNNNIYLKPNEIIKILNLSKGKYRLRIYFLKNLKSKLGLFLKMNKNNLIENGNFFAGLEATQTGDLDRSSGRNNFRIIKNPGQGQFVLEQDGISGNNYDMRITGIEPGQTYMFTCWVGVDGQFDANTLAEINSKYNVGDDLITGIYGIADTGTGPFAYGETFAGAGPDFTPAPALNIINTIVINNVTWHRISIELNPIEIQFTLGYLNLILSTQNGQGNSNPSGRRFFCDLRFVNITGDLRGVNYLNTLNTNNINGGVY